MKVSEWSKLNNLTGNILEFVDISKKNLNLKIGEVFEISYTKGINTRGIITRNVINEILTYQYSEENEGYFKAELKDDILTIYYLKGAF